MQFVDVDAVERYALLAECGSVRFEVLAPVAPFVTYRGQRSWSGRWWSATVGRHVAYRSWLARDHAMELDHDPHVLAYAARPFWLYFRDGLKDRRHGPDFFARRVDGTGVVVDCRSTAPVGRRDAGCAAMAQACELMEWEYRLVGELDEPRGSTLRWLAGYRHPRFADDRRAGLLRSWCKDGGGSVPLGALLARADGDLVMPTVLFHLLWHQLLRVEPVELLSEASPVMLPRAEPAG